MHAEMLTGLFAAIDRKDTDAFVGFLTEGASFRFGSAPAVVGREAIRNAVHGFFETVAGLSHVFHAPIVESDTLVVEGVVTYTRHDGSDVDVGSDEVGSEPSQRPVQAHAGRLDTVDLARVEANERIALGLQH